MDSGTQLENCGVDATVSLAVIAAHRFCYLTWMQVIGEPEVHVSESYRFASAHEMYGTEPDTLRCGEGCNVNLCRLQCLSHTTQGLLLQRRSIPVLL
jgi:hypothetical protein